MSDLSGLDADTGVRYEAVHRRAEPAMGERRLLLAVLEDGIRTLLKNAQASRGRALNLQREARSWLTADASGGVFTFANICDVLGIDPQRLRSRVLAEAERTTGSRAAH